MKILAIEKETDPVDWDGKHDLLVAEAKTAYEFYLSGLFREMYFTEEMNAVLILECPDLESARKLLDQLPLVKEKLIAFNLMELHAYTGFSRLMH